LSKKIARKDFSRFVEIAPHFFCYLFLFTSQIDVAQYCLSLSYNLKKDVTLGYFFSDPRHCGRFFWICKYCCGGSTGFEVFIFPFFSAIPLGLRNIIF
jgi:hypothetical protein